MTGLRFSIDLSPVQLSQLSPEDLEIVFAAIRVLQPFSRTRSPSTGWPTEERRKTLGDMWGSSDPWYSPDQIREALRNLPGPPIPGWSTIGVYAIQTLGVRRGKRTTQLRTPSIPTKELDEPTHDALPIEAEWDLIVDEARLSGFDLTSILGLPAFNKWRTAKGKRPYCLRAGVARKLYDKWRTANGKRPYSDNAEEAA